MDCGTSRVLYDPLGQEVYRWTQRGIKLSMEYDALRRLTTRSVDEGGGEGAMVVERTIYGEHKNAPANANLRGKVYKTFDQAGVVVNVEFGPRGELLSWYRQLVEEYKGTRDWKSEDDVQLQGSMHRSQQAVDALGRVTTQTLTDGTMVFYTYSQGGRLQSLSTQGPKETKIRSVLRSATYNARGQPTLLAYGNRVTTAQDFNPLTFVKRRIRSTDAKGMLLQDLQFEFDCLYKVVQQVNRASPAVALQSDANATRNEFTYDHRGRLVVATGRKHTGRASTGSPILKARYKGADASNPAIMSGYKESYNYDAAGNMLTLIHGSDRPGAGWTQQMSYAAPSLLESSKTSNRLTTVAIGSSTQTYGYGGAFGSDGSMTSMPGFSSLVWDYADQLKSSSRQRVREGKMAETTYYVYDAAGQRVRKVTEAQAAGSSEYSIIRETNYLTGLDVTQKYKNSQVVRRRTCVKFQADQRRIAMHDSVEDIGPNAAVPRFTTLRYQLLNYLPSVAVEVDAEGGVLSYEEYSPYGSTTFYHTSAELKTPKRYRFSGKELDKETGLLYCGRRYLSTGVARWISDDPAGLIDGPNVYAYVKNDPVNALDPTGLGTQEEIKVETSENNVETNSSPPPEEPPDKTEEEHEKGGHGDSDNSADEDSSNRRDKTWRIPVIVTVGTVVWVGLSIKYPQIKINYGQAGDMFNRWSKHIHPDMQKKMGSGEKHSKRDFDSPDEKAPVKLEFNQRNFNVSDFSGDRFTGLVGAETGTPRLNPVPLDNSTLALRSNDTPTQYMQHLNRTGSPWM